MPRPKNAGWAGTSDGVAARGFVNGRDLPRSGGRESTGGAHRSEVLARRQSRQREQPPARRQTRTRERLPARRQTRTREHGPCPQADPAAEQKQLAAAQPLGEGCYEIAENGYAKGRDENVGSLQHNGIGLDDEIAGHGN